MTVVLSLKTPLLTDNVCYINYVALLPVMVEVASTDVSQLCDNSAVSEL